MKSIVFSIRIAVLAVLLSISATAKAQQDPIFTHYLQNPIAFNPAVAGTVNGLNLSLLSRYQWLGIEGSPASYSFGAHTPYIKQNMGLGLIASTDNVGRMNNTNITAAYAYQITLFEGIKLSMGLKAGIKSYHASIGNLQVVDMDDPNFQNDDSWIAPNMGIGFYAYSRDFFAGFSIPTLMEAKLNKQYRESKQPYNPPLYLMGGYSIFLNKDWSILPSTLIGVMGGSPMSVDITMQAQYSKRVQFGTHYRIGDALGFFVSGKVYDELSVGYAFDFTLNKISTINSGTHEIFITYSMQGFWNTQVEGWRF